MIPVPCVVLAGGKAKPDLQAVIGHTNRALAVVNGKSLLSHVVDAASESDPDRPITVVGDVPESADYRRLDDRDDFVENVFSGVGVYADSPFVLLSTSDLPFLTAAVVSDFLSQALALAESSSANAIYPVVPVQSCYARFPGIRRTAIRLREGDVTGGNLMLIRPAFLLSQRKRLAEVYSARKHPARLALMLGLGTLFRLLLSQKVSPNLLTISQLETSASRLVGGPVRALLLDHPELATDLDRPSDFAAVRKADGVME
jgi:CTP:molybdopterin cytidylyltransferase MocA